jgi:hypothetical protein
MAKIDKQFMKGSRAAIEAALAQVGKELGIKFTVGSGTYDPSGAFGSYKLEMATADTKALEDAERSEWNRWCRMYNLAPEHFGVEVEIRGTGRCKIIGMSRRSNKFPFRVRQPNGKEISYSAQLADTIIRQHPITKEPEIDPALVFVDPPKRLDVTPGRGGKMKVTPR